MPETKVEPARNRHPARRAETQDIGRRTPMIGPEAWLSLQRLAGNAAACAIASTHTPQPSIQRAVMSVQDPESVHDPELDTDARKYHKRIGTGVLYSFDQNAILADKNTVEDTALDIFAHGSAGEVANWGAEHLVHEVVGLKATLKLSALRTLNLHSCESAIPLSLEDASASMIAKYKQHENTILAQRINDLFFSKGKYVVVTGYKGNVFTDSDRRSRILKEGKTEEDYKRARDSAATKAAKRLVEEEYLLAPEASLESYGRSELLTMLGLTETWEGQLSDKDLREKYDEYIKWLSREQDDEPSDEGGKPSPHIG